MTPSEFEQSIAVLIAGVGRAMPPAMVDAWRVALADLSADQLQGAIVRCLREYKFSGFPPVGQIREWAGVGEGGLRIEDRAALAWDRVLEAIRNVGAYRSVNFDDPAINATIRTLGGWQDLCDAKSDELRQFIRPRFLESYRAHVAAGVNEAAAEPLAGILASDAGRFGHIAPEPEQIDTQMPVSVKLLPSPKRETPRRLSVEFTPESVRKLVLSLPDVRKAAEQPVAETVGKLSEEEWSDRRAANMAALRRMVEQAEAK